MNKIVIVCVCQLLFKERMMYKLLIVFAIVALAGIVFYRVGKYKSCSVYFQKLRKALRHITFYVKYATIVLIGSVLVVANFSYFRELLESFLAPSTILTIRNILQFMFGSSSVMFALENMMIGMVFAVGSFSALAVVIAASVFDFLADEATKGSTLRDYDNNYKQIIISNQKCYRGFSRLLI